MKFFSSTPDAFFLLLFFSCVMLFSCGKNVPEIPGTNPEEQYKNLISAVSFIKYDSLTIDTPKAVFNLNHDTVSILVPHGTYLEQLTPIIKFDGYSISPKSGEPQNFLQPVPYTVTDKDGKKHTYIVTVSWYSNHSVVYMGSSSKTFFAFDAELGGFFWRYTTDKGSFSYSGPAVEKGVVYAGSTNDTMYAFDAASGRALWKFAADQAIEGGPAVKNGIVYFGSDDDYFYAVDALSGKLRWKYKTGYNIDCVPLILDGIVYTGSDDNNLYAFDAVTGVVKWTYQAEALYGASSPVYHDGIIFIGNRDANLYAVNATTGILKWKYYNGGISFERSRPTVNNGVVYIAGWYSLDNFNRKGSLYAIDEQTGILKATYLDSLGSSSSPVVDNGRLFVSTDDGYFNCVDTYTGAVIWRVRILPNSSNPLVVDDVVYVGGCGTGPIYTLDAKTGATKWTFPYDIYASETSTACLFALNGKVYHTNIPDN